MTVPAISMSASADRLGKNWTADSQAQDLLDGAGDQLGPAAQQLDGPGVRSRVNTQWVIVLTVES